VASRIGFFREVYRMIEDRLCPSGLHKHSKGLYSRRLTTEARGRVALNAATKYGFSINPLIGVQYIPLEELCAELDGRDPGKVASTITHPIGYLSPPHQFREWYFEEGRDNAEVVADMVHQITTVGFRYMEENCTLERVCERIKEGHFMMGNDVYQLPVGYMMLVRFDDAERVVRDHLAKIAAYKSPTIEEIEARMGEKLVPEALQRLKELEGQPIPAHERYRRFAERFFRKLEEERRRTHGQRQA
jgi:hypothetical protein